MRYSAALPKTITPISASPPGTITPIKPKCKNDRLLIEYWDDRATLDILLNGSNVRDAKIKGLTVPGIMEAEKTGLMLKISKIFGNKSARKRITGYWRSSSVSKNLSRFIWFSYLDRLVQGTLWYISTLIPVSK